ncbi:MAG: hypothetical protein QCI38_03675 [Candidatus Thermoplasmatota archaeon]|nr:hypothetical protein [Candidatus Thermoplasmatota archaeon]
MEESGEDIVEGFGEQTGMEERAEEDTAEHSGKQAGSEKQAGSGEAEVPGDTNHSFRIDSPDNSQYRILDILSYSFLLAYIIGLYR